MPRIAKEKVAPHRLHGIVQVDNNLSMRERMKKRFRPSDTVEVRNITNQDLEWQWLDEEDEHYTIEDDTNIKIMSREDPGLWLLKAGETDVLPGACAYLMIEALYKMVCVMKVGIVLHPLDEREVRNFSFDDPERQEQFIDAVFMRKLTPSMMHEAAVAVLPDSGEKKILEDLPPLATERSEWEKRKRSEGSMVTPPSVKENEHRNLSDLANDFNPGDSLLGTATGGLPSDREVPAASETNDQEEEVPAASEPAAAKVASAKTKQPAKV